MIKDLIRKNRSCRRFYQDHPTSVEALKELVDLARLSGSAANLQPLRYILSSDPEKNARIFSCLGWAGYLKDWPGPEEGERPSGYIIILADVKKATEYIGCDYGIAAQSILLGAREKSLAGCMLGSIKRRELKNVLNVPDELKILLVIAIGKPKEKVEIAAVGPDKDIKYWRDDKGVHHVPKRSLDDIILHSF